MARVRTAASRSPVDVDFVTYPRSQALCCASIVFRVEQRQGKCVKAYLAKRVLAFVLLRLLRLIVTFQLHAELCRMKQNQPGSAMAAGFQNPNPD